MSLEIEVRAIKMPQKTVLSLMKPTALKSSREWFSIDDIRDRLASVSETQASRVSSTVQQFQVLESRDERRHERCCCFCSCFSFLLRKPKKSSKSHTASNGHRQTDTHDGDAFKQAERRFSNEMHLSPSVNSVNNGRYNRYVSHSSTAHLATASPAPFHDCENLTSLLDMLQDKSQLLYSHLQCASSTARVTLLKYLEQKRGVLVLETRCDASLVIVSICTQPQQLDSLKRDFASGKLNRDLEGCIVTDEVLSHIGVLGLKLKTLINMDDVELAEHELGSV